MKNTVKAQCMAVTAVFSLAAASWADCPHCYGMANVKLVTKDGMERTGFMPIYGSQQYPEDGSEEPDIKAGVDLFRALSWTDWETLPLYTAFHKTLGVFPEPEEIALDHVEKIEFISWEDFAGAGRPPSVPPVQFRKLQEQRIYGVETIPLTVSDLEYVNLDPAISKKEFELLIRWEPSANHGYVFLIDSFWGAPNYPDLTDTGLLEAWIRKEEEGMGELLRCGSNAQIQHAFLLMKGKREQRLKACEALRSLLHGGDIKTFEEFAGRDGNAAILAAALKSLWQAVGRYGRASSWPEQWREAEQVLGINLQDSFHSTDLQDMNPYLFDRIISSHDIVSWEYSWD